MGAIRDTLLGYKHQKTENLLKTLEDKVLKNEASEKNSALKIVKAQRASNLLHLKVLAPL